MLSAILPLQSNTRTTRRVKGFDNKHFLIAVYSLTNGSKQICLCMVNVWVWLVFLNPNSGDSSVAIIKPKDEEKICTQSVLLKLKKSAHT
jgi:hypothetical protein